MPAPIVEYHKPGDLVTFTVGATAVEAGDVVALSGNMTVIPAAADSQATVGVAAYDAAVGDPVAVFIGGMVLPMTTAAGETLAAGDRVISAGGGQVKAADVPGATYVQAEAQGFLKVIGIALQAVGAASTGKVLLIH